MTRPVIVVGDAAVDLLVHFPTILDDERKRVQFATPELHGGGTGANTAVALSRLDVPTAFVGTVGNDSYGNFVQNDLASENIDTKYLFVDSSLNTVCVFAFIDDVGERYLYGWPRVDQAHRHIPMEKLDLAEIRQARWVHTTGLMLAHDSTGRDATIALLREAFQAGATTSLDLNLRVRSGELDPVYKQVVLEAMEYCSYVFGSGDEEFHYLNPQPTWEESARSFVREDRTIVVRMGPGGSMMMSASGTWQASAFPVEVVDTVGAGDVFNGGFIAACLQGLPPETALVWGNAVSAYKISHASARSCPSLDEIKQIISESEKN